jgi:hypothetical protein
MLPRLEGERTEECWPKVGGPVAKLPNFPAFEYGTRSVRRKPHAQGPISATKVALSTTAKLSFALPCGEPVSGARRHRAGQREPVIEHSKLPAASPRGKAAVPILHAHIQKHQVDLASHSVVRFLRSGAGTTSGVRARCVRQFGWRLCLDISRNCESRGGGRGRRLRKFALSDRDRLFARRRKLFGCWLRSRHLWLQGWEWRRLRFRGAHRGARL